MKKRGMLNVFVALVYFIILLPVVTVVAISFFDQQVISFPVSGFTVGWFEKAVQHHDFKRGLQTSLIIASLATLIGMPLGVAAGLGISRGRIKGSKAITMILLGPLIIPGVIAGAAIYMFLIRIGQATDASLSGSPVGLVLAHILLTIPWSVRLTLAGLEGQDEKTEEAAANLGARPAVVFWRVTLPKLRPAIVAASLFSFIQSFGDLEMSLFLVGPGTTTLPVSMLNYIEFRMDPMVAAVATIQILLVVGALLITDRFVRLGSVLR